MAWFTDADDVCTFCGAPLGVGPCMVLPSDGASAHVTCAPDAAEWLPAIAEQ